MKTINKSNLAVIDIETSGPNPFVHEILSIAIVPICGNIEPLSIFVRSSNIEWTDFSKNLFKSYSDIWESQAIAPEIACNVIEKYLCTYFAGHKVTPIGHNVGFDVAFLRKLAFLGGRSELNYLSHRAIDTHTMLYLLYLKNIIPSSALTSDGAFKYFNIQVPVEVRHTALGDALATKKLFHILAKHHGIQIDSTSEPNINANIR